MIHFLRSEILLFFILSILAIAAYVLPSIIAIRRNHNNGLAIVVLNIFFGWIGIGWVVALIWALTDNVGARAK